MAPEKRPDRARGAEHDTFWSYCARGELHLQRCDACSKVAWPPVQACAYCAGGALTWERMSGAGRILSWCTFERDYYKGAFPIPWDTILVELDEGPLFISNPSGFSWPQINANMRVRVSFIACEDSAGAFQLPVFKRA